MALSMGALLVPAPGASAAPAVPYCYRYQEASGTCRQIGAFPSNAATVKPRGLMIVIAGGGWQSSLPPTGTHPVSTSGRTEGGWSRWSSTVTGGATSRRFQ